MLSTFYICHCGRAVRHTFKCAYCEGKACAEEALRKTEALKKDDTDKGKDKDMAVYDEEGYPDSVHEQLAEAKQRIAELEATVANMRECQEKEPGIFQAMRIIGNYDTLQQSDVNSILNYSAPLTSHYRGFPLGGWYAGDANDTIAGRWCEDDGSYTITCPPQLRDLIVKLPEYIARLADTATLAISENDALRMILAGNYALQSGRHVFHEKTARVFAAAGWCRADEFAQYIQRLYPVPAVAEDVHYVSMRESGHGEWEPCAHSDKGAVPLTYLFY